MPRVLRLIIALTSLALAPVLYFATQTPAREAPRGCMDGLSFGAPSGAFDLTPIFAAGIAVFVGVLFLVSIALPARADRDSDSHPM